MQLVILFRYLIVGLIIQQINSWYIPKNKQYHGRYHRGSLQPVRLKDSPSTNTKEDSSSLHSNFRKKFLKSMNIFVHLLAASTITTSQLSLALDNNINININNNNNNLPLIEEAALSPPLPPPLTTTTLTAPTTAVSEKVDYSSFKIPYFHSNIPMKKVLGEKATIVVNMKLDDPQTSNQFPALTELYNKYGKDGLNILIFPTDQGWFEPDDDETCRLKAKEYYQFGDFPHAVVFDKVDVVGPSAHPLYVALTNQLPTPNGYTRITLNYEKFLLNAEGEPVRRYPRKVNPLELSSDIEALLKGEALPAESPLFLQSWREAKREVPKSEYSFRFNYNYYNSPNSMYKYNPLNDAPDQSR